MLGWIDPKNVDDPYMLSVETMCTETMYTSSLQLI